jgi:multidrug resistance efflux pump
MKAKAVTIVCIVIAVGVGVLWWRMQHADDDAGAELTVYGNIDIRQVELSFHDPEHIAQMLVKEGDRVTKGQLLAVQDLDRFQYAVDIAAARVEAQWQVVARLVTGSRPEDIGKARADTRVGEADVVFAEKEYRRMLELSKKKFVSVEEADRARAQLDEARARLKALQEVLERTVTGPRKEDIAAAKAELKEKESALKLARRVLADAHIYAPSDGVIQDRILEPGDMADAKTPVYTLALVDPVWARTYVSERYLGKLHPGMSARITTDSHPDKVYPGWVGFISPTAEFTPKAVETPELRTSLVYQVRVFACNPEDELRLGMPVTVVIPLDAAADGRNASGKDACQKQ